MMLELKRLSPGIFLAAACLWAPILCAEESFPDVPPALSASSETAAEEPMQMEAMDPGMTTEGATPEVDGAVAAAQQEVRDPFATTNNILPLEPVAPELASMAGPMVTVELKGIGFGSADAYAVIGDDVFFIGDEKNGIKLVEVRRREVDIIANGQLMTYPLFPDEDLKSSKERKKKKRAASDPSADLKSENPSAALRRE